MDVSGERNLGQYTFVSHNGLSVVDYLLCNFADSQCIKNFCILNCNEFSDHSPVFFSLAKEPASRDTLHSPFCQQKLLYDEERVSIFRNQLLTYGCVLDQLTENVNIGQIDTIVQSFTNYLYDSAFSAFGKTWTSKSSGPKSARARAKNPWFDEKCRNARNDFKRARNLFLKCKNDVNRQSFVSMRSKYNKIKRVAKKKSSD